jgi:hypothetical protein
MQHLSREEPRYLLGSPRWRIRCTREGILRVQMWHCIIYIYPQIFLSHPPTAPQNQWTFIRVEELDGHGMVSGRYIIKNRKHKNVAKLCDASDRSSVVADNRQDDPGEMVSSSISLVSKLVNNSLPIQWNIIYLRNGTYKIENYGYGSSFATAENGFWAQEKDCVVAGTHPYQWKIIEMPDKGVYWYALFCIRSGFWIE